MSVLGSLMSQFDNVFQSEGLHDAEHFVDALPEDAMMMSRTGTAHGYDHLRFGLKWESEGKNPGRPIAQINKAGVQLLVISDRERDWIAEVQEDSTRWAAREKMVRQWNFTPWPELADANREFLLSLFWIPAEPLTAMEIIARMAQG